MPTTGCLYCSWLLPLLRLACIAPRLFRVRLVCAALKGRKESEGSNSTASQGSYGEDEVNAYLFRYSIATSHGLWLGVYGMGFSVCGLGLGLVQSLARLCCVEGWKRFRGPIELRGFRRKLWRRRGECLFISLFDCRLSWLMAWSLRHGI